MTLLNIAIENSEPGAPPFETAIALADGDAVVCVDGLTQHTSGDIHAQLVENRKYVVDTLLPELAPFTKDDPNFVQVLGWCQDEQGHTRLVYRQAEGYEKGSVGMFREWTPAEQLLAITQICGALGRAHKAVHALHRDLKPSNILTNRNNPTAIIMIADLEAMAKLDEPMPNNIGNRLSHMYAEEGITATPAMDLSQVAKTIACFYGCDLPKWIHDAEQIKAQEQSSGGGFTGTDPIEADDTGLINMALDYEIEYGVPRLSFLRRVMRMQIGNIDVGDILLRASFLQEMIPQEKADEYTWLTDQFGTPIYTFDQLLAELTPVIIKQSEM